MSDPAAGIVDVFAASGAFLTRIGDGTLLAAGIAIDETTGSVYVADTFSNEVLVFAPSGSGGFVQVGEWDGAALPGEQFGEVTGVAVDNSEGPSAGDVYVVDGEDPRLSEGVVDVFKPRTAGPEEGAEGSLLRVLSKGKMEEPNGVAVDSSSGRVYVADSEMGSVLEYSASGAFEGKSNGSGSPLGPFAGKEEEEGNVSAVAVDPSSGDLLVAEGERGVVSEFNQAGEWEGWISSAPPAAALGQLRGVAVASSGQMYVTDSLLARVDIYGPGVVVANVSTEKATKLTRTTAILNGTLNGLGKPGHYFFQWGSTSALGASTPSSVFSGGEEAIGLALGELHANSTYFYRLVAEDEDGLSYGVTKRFTTPTAVEDLSTGPITSLQPESAMLTGTLTPNGFDAHYYFEWGTTTAYGKTSPGRPGTDAGLGKASVKAETALGGLSPNTVYHYRLVAENQFGTTFGSDEKFTTSGPPRITSKPVTGIGHETATLNAEVNPDELATTYHFEYGPTNSYGTETPPGGASIGSSATPVPITAALTGLTLGVTYHYRVIASNSDGSVTGPDYTLTTIPPALITTSASEVKATEATLQAEINPLGHATTYYFQYGTQACQPNPTTCTSTPVPPGEDIGAGEQPVAKTLKLTDLTPDTTYHYRVVATNILGTSEGTEHVITTPEPISTFVLPDNRAWELVTPPDKEGAPVEALTREGGIILASENGDKLTYVVDGALGNNAEGNRSPEWQQILATREPTSWISQDVSTPNSKATGLAAGAAPEYQYFSPDLSNALVEPAGAEPFLASGVTHPTPYLRDDATGTYAGLVTEAMVTAGALTGVEVHFLDASPDLSHVVLSANGALTGPKSAAGLYEWAGGSLSFVTALPTGTPATKAELGFHGRVFENAVSTNGTRVFWTNKEENAGGGHLYVRDTAKGETLQVDAAQGAVEPGVGSAQFQGATPGGAVVFFTDKQKLTAGSTAEPNFPEKADLYECVIAEIAGKLACELTDLTVDVNESEHAAVQGILLGEGEDGTDVYFVAQGILSANANRNSEGPVAGGDNLYWAHFDGSHWTRRFIATLPTADSPEWEGNKVADTAFVTARVSSNGRYLAFMSAASLTGYDNVDVKSEAKGARDEEVYLYDSATASLTCVSCDPTGARPSGVLDHNEAGEGLGLLVDRRKVWAELGHERWLAGNIPGWTAQSLTSALFQSRYLSDEGRLYFNSPEELVPAAKDHKENVYEYEPSGIGSCESKTGGCVSLISSGTSEHESAFIEATPSGSNVFFVTESQLLPQDTDTAFDIYDARECSAESPCQTIPAPPPGGCTTTETCRPVSTSQGGAAGPGYGTASFTGSGNFPLSSAPQTQVEGEKTTKPQILTRAQRLAKALKLCRRLHSHSKHKRVTCEASARKLYSPPRVAVGGRRTLRRTTRQGSR